MSLELYVAFVAATAILIVMPGPVVSLVIANSLTHGTRAGLVTVGGAQAAIADPARRGGVRPHLGDGGHGRVVRVAALGRRRLSRLAGHPEMARHAAACPRSGRAATRGEGRDLCPGIPGRPHQPQVAVLLRRLLPAVSRRRARRPGRSWRCSARPSSWWPAVFDGSYALPRGPGAGHWLKDRRHVLIGERHDRQLSDRRRRLARLRAPRLKAGGSVRIMPPVSPTAGLRQPHRRSRLPRRCRWSPTLDGAARLHGRPGPRPSGGRPPHPRRASTS